jgi:hypothetical protein
VLSTRALKSGTVLDIWYPHVMSCPALSLLQYLIFVAAYLENPDSHRYVDASRRTFLTGKLEICTNSSFRPAQKLIRGTMLLVSFKHVHTYAVYVYTFTFARYFYFLCNPVIYYFACTFVFNWETVFKDI